MLSKMKVNLLSCEEDEDKDLTVNENMTDKNNKPDEPGEFDAKKTKLLNDLSPTHISQIGSVRQKIKKLTLRELEVLVLQKIAEVLVEQDLSAKLQTMIKNQQEIAVLQEALEEQKRQYRHLNTVHEKLLEEIEIQKKTGVQKPLVPLIITRSVGIQVKIEDMETKQPTDQQLLAASQTSVNKKRQKRLSQALRKKKRTSKQVVTKRTTPSPIIQNTAEKSGSSVVINLDSDDDDITVSAIPDENKPGDEPDALPSAPPKPTSSMLPGTLNPTVINEPGETVSTKNYISPT